MMRTVKIWMLDSVEPSDIEYLKGANIPIEMTQEHRQEITAGGQIFYFAGSPPMVKLITVDEKSESMLQLKYSHRVRLLQYYSEAV